MKNSVSIVAANLFGAINKIMNWQIVFYSTSSSSNGNLRMDNGIHGD
jgi:hypothetical protein